MAPMPGISQRAKGGSGVAVMGVLMTIQRTRLGVPRKGDGGWIARGWGSKGRASNNACCSVSTSPGLGRL